MDTGRTIGAEVWSRGKPHLLNKLNYTSSGLGELLGLLCAFPFRVELSQPFLRLTEIA